jgi:hypothetical protein
MGLAALFNLPRNSRIATGQRRDLLHPPVRSMRRATTRATASLVACVASMVCFLEVAEARDLTSTEQANIHSYLTIINDNLSGQTSAKNSLDTLLRDATTGMTTWSSTFADYFESHLLKENLAEYLHGAPLDSNENVEYRKRFQTATVSGAGQRLITRVTDAGGLFDLGVLMNEDCVVREDVLQVLELLEKAAIETPFTDLTPGSRNTFYDAMRTFVQSTEPALEYDVVYTSMTGPSATQPWAGPIRARLLRAIRGIKPADTTGRVFSTDFSVPTAYAQILYDFNTMVQDNGAFTLDGRLDPIFELLDSFPVHAETPSNVATKEVFGNVCPTGTDGNTYPPTLVSEGGVAAWGSENGCNLPIEGDSSNEDNNGRCLPIGVNVHNYAATGVNNTVFPQSESRWQDSQFYNLYCHQMAHEVTHALRPESGNSSHPNYFTQETAAVERACNNPLNYLRSKSGSFCGSGTGTCTSTCDHGKIEFLAYISQMFFMDTEKTLKVAHRRAHCKELDSQFHIEPLNQFLLFANLVAASPTGTTTVPFYQALDGTGPSFTDVCDLTPDYQATITRNSNGCITSISYQPPGQPLRQFAFLISSTNPTHCKVTSMSPSFASVYPAEGGATNCPQ